MFSTRRPSPSSMASQAGESTSRRRRRVATWSFSNAHERGTFFINPTVSLETNQPNGPHKGHTRFHRLLNKALFFLTLKSRWSLRRCELAHASSRLVSSVSFITVKPPRRLGSLECARQTRADGAPADAPPPLFPMKGPGGGGLGEGEGGEEVQPTPVSHSMTWTR